MWLKILNTFGCYCFIRNFRLPMFNEHLILKALCHIIWNWHLFVECLVNFMLCACSSPSDLSLCSASQSLSISKYQSSNSAQILKSTEISWNIFGSSGPFSEVPDFLRKFRTSPEVPDFSGSSEL